MILFINTTQSEKTTIIIDDGRRFYIHTFFSEFHQAEKLLKGIDFLLKKRKSSVNDLKGVVIVIGPGPFTALRIGLIVANTIAYTLKIKTAGLKQSDFSSIEELIEKGKARIEKAKGFKILEPYYGKKPNITRSKLKCYITS